MEILGKDDQPDILPIIKGRTTLLRTYLLQMKVGEVLFMPNEEWRSKATPRHVVARIKKTLGYVFEYGRKTDRSGWLFKRIK